MKKRIFLSIIIIILFFSNTIYAKYNMILETNSIAFSRDTNLPKYEIFYSETDWTNKDVTITLKTDKSIETPEGYTTLKEGRIFSKVVSKNETKEEMIKDYSGNKTFFNYSVNNIDKIKPEILGINDLDKVNTDVKLTYRDNVGIKEISVDKYSYLDFRVFDDFYDVDTYFGIDTLDNKITARILSHPKGTEKYKYYLNGILYGITENVEYTFTGLNPGNVYSVKIEALDSNNNVISQLEKNTETNFFSDIITKKTDDLYKAKLINIDSRIKKYRYSIWSDENKDDSITWYEGGQVTDKTLNIEFNRLNFGRYTNKSYIYRIHIFLQDESNNIISILPINVLFGKSATPQKEIDIYNLTEKRKL